MKFGVEKVCVMKEACGAGSSVEEEGSQSRSDFLFVFVMVETGIYFAIQHVMRSVFRGQCSPCDLCYP